MGKTRTELDDAYRREIRDYLENVQHVMEWSQSEIARKIGAHSSTVNKAFKEKHTLDYPKLLVLADQSGHPLPESLTRAAKAAGAPLTASDTKEARDAAAAARDFHNRPKDWQDQFLQAIGRAK